MKFGAICPQDPSHVKETWAALFMHEGKKCYLLQSCTNFMFESAGFGDRRTSALGKFGKEIYHSLKNIVDKVECVGAV